MKHTIALSLFAALPFSLIAAEKPADSFRMNSIYRQVGSAKFRTHSVKGTHLHFADAYGAACYTHHLNAHNALEFQLSYANMKLDWDENPRFKQDHFNLGIASLGWTSNSIEKWHWNLNLALSADAAHPNLAKTGVYRGLMWGRYAFTKDVGFHVGFFGFTGIRTTRTLPVAGIDWKWHEKWKLNAIFPLDFSLLYNITDSWVASVAYTAFGGPYRFPWRVHGGHGRFHDAIVEVNSNGTHADLTYHYLSNFSAGIGGGWNFGGWILTRNHKGHHGRYYKFDSAPYGQAHLKFAF